MIEFLQGKWMKHPLHPAIVHIPVSMWVGSFLFDLIALTGVAPDILSRLSTYALGFGLLVALVAIPTGIADWWGIGKDKPAWQLGILHMAFNWVASLAFGLSLGIRLGNNISSPPETLPLLLSLAGVGFISAGAYLGGRMAYDFGTSIARNSKEKWREIAVEGKAQVPSK